MSTRVKIIIPLLFLALIATAADNKVWQHYTTFVYRHDAAKTVYISARLFYPSDGTVVTAPHLNIFLYESEGYRRLNASGTVPASILKFTGNGFKVQLADLRDLVSPDFILTETGFAGPIPVNIIARENSIWTNTNTSYDTLRIPQPDGTVVMTKYRSQSTMSTFNIAGNIGGYTFTGSTREWLDPDENQEGRITKSIYTRIP
jgi:hypothetical protein